MTVPITRVEVRGVSKSFGETHALQQVSLVATGGSVHAFTGENGAGKSTLMKLLAGVHTPDAGDLLLDGVPLHFRNPAHARAAGISTVFQELTIIPTLSVAENIYLGNERLRAGQLDAKAMAAGARQLLERVGVASDVHAPCGSLSIAQQQMVEVAKGLSVDAKVFIFDEPTASLNRHEVELLAAVISQLKAQGKVVLYISHRLHEIFRFCNVVTVLKDGRLVDTRGTAELTPEHLVTLMVGRPLQALFPPRQPTRNAPLVLDVQALAVRAVAPTISLQIRSGEIVGLAGLEGQGQRELLRALAGVQPPAAGQFRKLRPDGTAASYEPERGASHCVAAGVGFIPEDRKGEGLYLSLPIADNLRLGVLQSHPLWRRAPNVGLALRSLYEKLNLVARGLEQEVESLSGGNQQKVLLGRWLLAGVDVLLIEQPTRGVDIAARIEIYKQLRHFCVQGGAVLVASGDLPELIGLADRLLVIRDGAIVAELPAEGATEEEVLSLALSPEREAA